MSRYATIAVFVLLSLYARADVDSGNVLLRKCANAMIFLDGGTVPPGDTATIEFTECVSYIAGIKDATWAFHYVQKGEEPSSTRVCLPAENIENGQAVRVAVKYMKEHPAELHAPAFVLVLNSLRESFPCK